ncbi:MAG TPA: SDR family oxidoreductase [Terriglobales bacterium]|nr:SDR family oxidoreductase [Terriglobales bacterium]
MGVMRVLWKARKLRPLRTLAIIGAGGMALAGVGASVTAYALWRRLTRGEDMHGKVVLITGGSRGLGLAMAQEFAAAGARIVLCARDQRELDWAREELSRAGADVSPILCDVSNQDEVARMVNSTVEIFGRIDVLVNNAGVITVGPLQTQTSTDFQEAMDVMFRGTVYPTLAVLPHMLQRRSGRIANITSIGGKVAVPHLLPYDCAKFAAVGFSEGLHAEVARYGVKVTTVVPGLMRTGSFVNAYFKGDNEAEYKWFSLSSAMPGLAMSGRRAARAVVRAIRQGRSEIVLTPQAKLLAMFHGLFPGVTADILGVVNRVLPDDVAQPSSAVREARERRTGKESESALTLSPLTRFGREAAKEFHQYPERRGESDGEAELPVELRPKPA